ncbi:MAG: ABC transporter substrate-binding protein [Actinomycetota bacterium]
MTGTTAGGRTSDARRALHRRTRRVVPPAALVLAVILVSTMVAVTARPDGAPSGVAVGERTQAPGATIDPGGGNPTGAAAQRTGVGAVASAANDPSAVGVARSGVACTDGARQVPWSRYAPTCTPAFDGDNGGATAPGVTRDRITLSYRTTNTAQQQALTALVGDAIPSDQSYLSDLEAYLDLFNANFELFGRRVVIEPFQGQGDFLLENIGQGQEKAQADAVTARQLGAFADVTIPTAQSLFYSHALVDQEVISWGFLYGPQSWYEELSPFQYSVLPSGSKLAAWWSNLACQRMRGLPAIFAGDEAMHDDERVFGLITLETPTWLEVADEIEHRLARCGVELARRVSYPLDIGAFQQNAANIAAQMHQAGVTTVICFCDGLFTIFLTKAASKQEYRPEWIPLNVHDAAPQLADQSQFAHAISNGPSFRPKDSSEAYAAFKLARPDTEPAAVYYELAYFQLLQVFAALQAAGPELTPGSFQQGMFSLPPSLPGGDFGDWSFGPRAFTPTASAGIVYWDPDRLSPNGKRGSWAPCEDDVAFPFDRPDAWGPAGTQIRCFGR